MKTASVTEARLWRIIAKDIATNPNSSPYICDHIYCESKVQPYTRPDWCGLSPVGVAMRDRVKAHIPHGWFSAYGEVSKDEGDEDLYGPHREARALACLWLALEAEEEA